MKYSIFVVLVGLLLPFAVMAQENEEIEEIVVLGSHIKGGDITGVLPITSLSAEDIDNLGVLDGDELFRSIPSQGFVGFHNQDVSGGINDVRGDSSSFNLRAVGTGYTLALINSRRMVLQPGWASEEGVPVVSANPNAIPVAGIQRVEVMRDGASALYGTDAIGGAVNSILRGKVNKTTISLRKGQSRHTSRKDNSAYFRTGYSSRDKRTTISFFGDYRDRTALPASQRVYAASDDRRPLVVGTEFEGDTDFDSRSAYTPWGIFAAIIPDSSGFGARIANDKRVYYDGSNIVGDNGAMRILPATHGDCVEDGVGADPSYCYDDSSSVSRLTRFDKNSLRQIVPRLQRSNFFTNFEHQLNANITLYGEMGYYRARTIRSKEQSANLPNAVVTAPASSYWNPFGPKEFSGTANPNRLPDLKICGDWEAGGSASRRYSCSSSRRDDLPDGGLAVDLIRYRPVDMGPRITEVENESWRFLIGGEGEITLLGIDWDWDSAALHSSYESYDLTRNRVSSTKLQEAIGWSNANAYNPFNGGSIAHFSTGDTTPSPQAALEHASIDVYKRGVTKLTLVDFTVSNNEALVFASRPIGVAVGTEYRKETFLDDRDPHLDGTITFTNSVTGAVSLSDVYGSSPTADAKGSREISSLFGEMVVPLVSPVQDMFMVQDLTIQLAARFEQFSDVGGNFKPRIAASWTLIPDVMFRASWQQGFRAPNLAQIHGDVSRAATVTDYVECEQNDEALTGDDCEDRSYRLENLRAGSKELESEDSENLSFGVVIQPRFLYGLTLTVDYWQIKQENLVGILGDENQVLLDLYLRERGGCNPNVVRAESSTTNCTSIAGAGQIMQIIDPYRNFEGRSLRGFDIGLEHSMPLFSGEFTLSANAARLLEFDQDISPSVNQLVEAGYPTENAGSLLELDGRPKWRGTVNLRWRSDRFGIGATWRYISAFNDSSATRTQDGERVYWRVASWQTANLNLTYYIENGPRLRLGINNVEDKEPPLADESFGYYGGIHNSIGRYVYFDMRMSF